MTLWAVLIKGEVDKLTDVGLVIAVCYSKARPEGQYVSC